MKKSFERMYEVGLADGNLVEMSARFPEIRLLSPKLLLDIVPQVLVDNGRVLAGMEQLLVSDQSSVNRLGENAVEAALPPTVSIPEFDLSHW